MEKLFSSWLGAKTLLSKVISRRIDVLDRTIDCSVEFENLSIFHCYYNFIDTFIYSGRLRD